MEPLDPRYSSVSSITYPFFLSSWWNPLGGPWPWLIPLPFWGSQSTSSEPTHCAWLLEDDVCRWEHGQGWGHPWRPVPHLQVSGWLFFYPNTLQWNWRWHSSLIPWNFNMGSLKPSAVSSAHYGIFWAWRFCADWGSWAILILVRKRRHGNLSLIH